MIRAVIFDLDDTLVSTWPIKLAHHKETAKKFYKYDLSEEEVRKHWGKPFKELLEELFGKHDNSYENILKNYLSLDNDFPKQIIANTKKTLGKLSEKGIKLAIVTSTNTDRAVKHLGELGFDINMFVSIQGADKTDFHKPDGKVFGPIIDLLEKKGITKKEMVYVGDSMLDMEGAKNAQIGFIAVTTGLYTKEDFINKGIDTLADDIEEILNFILT